MTQYHCYSLKLATYLIERGFKVIEILSNEHSEGMVYMFKDSVELKRALFDYHYK